MAFLFRPSLPANESKGEIASKRRHGKTPDEPAAELIPATELPPAADALAELFPEDPRPAEASADVNGAFAEPAPVLLPATAEASAMPSETGPVAHVTPPSSDWALEERLASHKEWFESQGATGRRADLASANLEGAELIGINLRCADLQDANLKGTDLLLADLRGACLVRADLEESCLVGANLEGANLEGAMLETAMGLVPRQLAGANVRDTSLPKQIMEFEALREFERASQVAFRLLLAILSLSLLSWLMIWETKDVQLLSDSAIIQFLHSPAAAAALPTVELYLIAPTLLVILYLAFHFHLQRLWDSVLELPAIFPDGRELGDDGSRVILGLLRAHFRWMNQDPPSTRLVEKGLSLVLAYWVVPATLLLFWARYLTLQEIHGTILHELLIMVTTGVALYSTTKIGRPKERWTTERSRVINALAKLKMPSPLTLALGLGIVLTILSAGTIAGIPHETGRAPQFNTADIRRWAPTVLWSFGFDPYANLTEAAISKKPPDWNGADDQVPSVTGARLNNTNFRYAQAYGVFLVNAHLWRADFKGAFLSNADLREADLSQANLQFAIMDRAQINHANLDRANLDGANLSRADLRAANLSYASLADAILVDARLDGASFYGAQLPSATLIRASLEKADLRNTQLEYANLERADMQQAYLWAAKLQGAHLENAQLQAAIFIDADLRGANLRGAQFSGTVLNGVDLSGANLESSDLRGALQLSASQICSTKSRQGALLDDAMQALVDAQCGLPH
jgi:uncharacterized protein YjbI with pentapeptide repeats